jgi:hypothetical protein
VTDSGVRLVRAVSLPTVVVAGATTWEEFPSRWGPMLDQVYAAVRPAAPGRPIVGEGRWQNVMLYKDDVPNIEVGVLASGPFSPTGNVISSVLPGGAAATTTHRGPYVELDAAHRSIRDWCARRGHRLAGPRWEIYGHWTDNPNELETEVYYLLG